MIDFEDKINAADIVSFDVFDTLLVRNVARPTDLFKIVQENFNQFSRYYLSPDFTNMRIKAEQDAYGASLVAGHVTLDDIYGQFQKRYGFDQEFCEVLKQTEIATEKDALRCNLKLKKLYDYAQAQHKKILVVSDMYLPKKVIVEALRSNGYDGWDEIVISCHDKLTKHDGAAFAYLRQKYGDKKILHVGDNVDSDIGWAKAYGLDTILVIQDLRELSYENTQTTQTSRGGKLLEIANNNTKHSVNDTQQSVVAALIAHKMTDTTATASESIGYSALGPLLLGFVQWLHNAAQKSGINHLYFLARDGAIMQRAYEAYYSTEAITHDYIFASRRLYNFAKITDQLTESDIDFLAASDESMEVRGYFERFGISTDDEVVARALVQVGLTPGKLVEGATYQKLRSAFVLSAETILKKSEAERQVLHDYLASVGIDKVQKKAVVDIGWHGTLQRSLSKLLGRQVVGLYFGIHEVSASRAAGTAMQSFSDERLPNDEVFHHLIKLGVEVVEYLFANPDQESVTAIAKSGSSYKQVIHKTDKDADTLQADEDLRVIQSLAIDFIHDYKEATKNWANSIKILDRAVAFQEFSLLVQEPSDQQALIIGRVKHGFAEGLPPRYIGMPMHDDKYYRLHPGALCKERDIAYWQRGFLKNVSVMQLDRYL